MVFANLVRHRLLGELARISITLFFSLFFSRRGSVQHVHIGLGLQLVWTTPALRREVGDRKVLVEPGAQQGTDSQAEHNKLPEGETTQVRDRSRVHVPDKPEGLRCGAFRGQPEDEEEARAEAAAQAPRMIPRIPEMDRSVRFLLGFFLKNVL